MEKRANAVTFKGQPHALVGPQLKPGDKLPMHSHPANVVYFVTGGKTKTVTVDGKTTETEHKAGEAVWSNAITHSNENIGSAPTKAVVVELKTAK